MMANVLTMLQDQQFEKVDQYFAIVLKGRTDCIKHLLKISIQGHLGGIAG